MSWQDVADKTKNQNNSGNKTNYVKLEQGVTRLRIRDEEPVSRWVHWIPQANGGKGLSVTCIGKGCPVCREMFEDKKAKRKTKYSSRKQHAINVLTRSFTNPAGVSTTINEPQVLDSGNQVFDGLLVVMKQMGDLRNYDVMITKQGESFGEIKYTVLPTFPPSELTEAEKALPVVDLNTMVAPLTAEQIEMLMQGAMMEAVLGANTENATDNSAQGLQVDFTQS
jgi:hypothetical protein